METHRLVLPAHLNHYGSLFGGRLLAWVDEACWIAASLDYPHCHLVTVGMEAVEFRHGVGEGAILRIRCERVREGDTSATYQVEVADVKSSPRAIFATRISFVSIDDAGKKRSLRAG